MGDLLKLAYELERIAERERTYGGVVALPKSDCDYLEKAAAALRAQAMQSREAC